LSLYDVHPLCAEEDPRKAYDAGRKNENASYLIEGKKKKKYRENRDAACIWKGGQGGRFSGPTPWSRSVGRAVRKGESRADFHARKKRLTFL